jgi:hypothetical protein
MILFSPDIVPVLLSGGSLPAVGAGNRLLK